MVILSVLGRQNDYGSGPLKPRQYLTTFWRSNRHIANCRCGCQNWVMEPREILAHVRSLILEYAGNDPDRWWYGNRFVYARLHLDERKTKTAIKQRLLRPDATCHFCGKPFDSSKGFPLHRLDDTCGYSDANCVLAHMSRETSCSAWHARQKAISRQCGARCRCNRHFDQEEQTIRSVVPLLVGHQPRIGCND